MFGMLTIPSSLSSQEHETMEAIAITELKIACEDILERINKKELYTMWEDDASYQTDQQAFWNQKVLEARAAETHAAKNTAEKFAYMNLVGEEMKRCKLALQRAKKFSALLWTQLCEDEEYEVDSLEYWKHLADSATAEADSLEDLRYCGIGKQKFHAESRAGQDILLTLPELLNILSTHHATIPVSTPLWKLLRDYDPSSAYMVRSQLVNLIERCGGTVQNTDAWWTSLQTSADK